MTRKDYQLIAGTLNDSVQAYRDMGATEDTIQLKVLRDVAEDMADNLRQTNPRFDRERFMTACGF